MSNSEQADFEPVLLIHGTFAYDENEEADADHRGRWWQRESDFWRAMNALLEKSNAGCAPKGADRLKVRAWWRGYFGLGSFWDRLQDKVYEPDPTKSASKDSPEGVFHWSGENRESARRQAAKLLFAHLKQFNERGSFHVIAHSHGGSVLWEALCLAVSEKKKSGVRPAPEAHADNNEGVPQPAPEAHADNNEGVPQPAPEAHADNNEGAAQPAHKTQSANNEGAAPPTRGPQVAHGPGTTQPAAGANVATDAGAAEGGPTAQGASTTQQSENPLPNLKTWTTVGAPYLHFQPDYLGLFAIIPSLLFLDVLMLALFPLWLFQAVLLGFTITTAVILLVLIALLVLARFRHWSIQTVDTNLRSALSLLGLYLATLVFAGFPLWLLQAVLGFYGGWFWDFWDQQLMTVDAWWISKFCGYLFWYAALLLVPPLIVRSVWAMYCLSKARRRAGSTSPKSRPDLMTLTREFDDAVSSVIALGVAVTLLLALYFLIPEGVRRVLNAAELLGWRQVLASVWFSLAIGGVVLCLRAVIWVPVRVSQCHRRRVVQEEAWKIFERKYLCVGFTEQDEAFLGLNAVKWGIRGRLLPRFPAPRASDFSTRARHLRRPEALYSQTTPSGWAFRFLALPVAMLRDWVIRPFYNEVFATLVDEFVLNQLYRRAVGLDIPGLRLSGVSDHPMGKTDPKTQASCPQEARRFLSRRTDKNAVRFVRAMRTQLAVNTPGAVHLDEFLKAMQGEQDATAMLVHTSYFDSEALRKLFEQFIGDPSYRLAVGPAQPEGAESGALTVGDDRPTRSDRGLIETTAYTLSEMTAFGLRWLIRLALPVVPVVLVFLLGWVVMYPYSRDYHVAWAANPESARSAVVEELNPDNIENPYAMPALVRWWAAYRLLHPEARDASFVDRIDDVRRRLFFYSKLGVMFAELDSKDDASLERTSSAFRASRDVAGLALSRDGQSAGVLDTLAIHLLGAKWRLGDERYGQLIRRLLDTDELPLGFSYADMIIPGLGVAIANLEESGNAWVDPARANYEVGQRVKDLAVSEALKQIAQPGAELPAHSNKPTEPPLEAMNRLAYFILVEPRWSERHKKDAGADLAKALLQAFTQECDREIVAARGQQEAAFCKATCDYENALVSGANDKWKLAEADYNLYHAQAVALAVIARRLNTIVGLVLSVAETGEGDHALLDKAWTLRAEIGRIGSRERLTGYPTKDRTVFAEWSIKSTLAICKSPGEIKQRTWSKVKSLLLEAHDRLLSPECDDRQKDLRPLVSGSMARCGYYHRARVMTEGRGAGTVVATALEVFLKEIEARGTRWGYLQPDTALTIRALEDDGS